MKKHPVIKFILILVISGACGALTSFLLMGHESAIGEIIKNFSTFFGSISPILHIGICLILSLTAIYGIHRMKKMLGTLTPDNEEEVYAQLEKQSYTSVIMSVLCTIFNFFFLGSSFVYMLDDNILISAAATLVFVCVTTWIEVTQVNLTKKINPRFKDADPMSLRFMKDWEKASDEAETFEMYRAAYHSFKNLKYMFLAAFLICCFVQMLYPIGLTPFILIAIFWGIHTLSYVFASFKSSKTK